MEDTKISAPVENGEQPSQDRRPTGNPNYEPRGSRAAARPGDRKYGDRKGRPGERRGGRGGFVPPCGPVLYRGFGPRGQGGFPL